VAAKGPFKTDQLCLRCRKPLWWLGTGEFRLGGSSGPWHVLFGKWAHSGEEVVPLEVLACRECMGVELRIPQD
jgi:hypothetical protein